MQIIYKPYQCQSCSTVVVFDGREPLANASCPLCLSRLMAIEEMEATWKGFVCHHCGGQFSIQASRSPYKCPICLSTSLEPAPQDEPYLFGTRHIKGVNAAKTSTNRPGSRQAPWQPVALRQETWKDWMEGILLFATHEIGFFVCLATIGVVIGLLYMIFRLLSRAIFWAF